MSLSSDDVTAVIVTRGDVDLEPVIATLPYGDVRVWDNSTHPFDAKCYGRWLATLEGCKPAIYMQDDDLLFTEHDALLALYDGRLLVNMPSPWYERAGYERDRCLLVGAGSLQPRGACWPAFDRYFAAYPYDDLFRTYCDFVHGILTPGVRCDLGYEVLPYATGPGRIVTAPRAQVRKRVVMNRALELRG